MTNPAWSMAGIFADEGITGTSTKNRKEFQRMIRLCKQKKIDVILVKSISRFARNTVDCLKYIRLLRELGIAVIFEKENINTMETDCEIFLTLYGAFAQAESESMSGNITTGQWMAAKEGKATFQYKRLYAYEKGPDGQPAIIPAQAEIVRELYRRFLVGDSLRMLKAWLETNHIPNIREEQGWTVSAIRSILTNEKYCGDVLWHKTYTVDCISHKVARNTGQRPMVLMRDHHAAIVSREDFNAVQVEMKRRLAVQSPSSKASTGQSSYTSKYALSDRLVCGECGTLYRRCTWVRKEQKKIVWRCVSRLDYGSKYCKASPTMKEGPLQQAILTAVHSVMRKPSEMATLLAGTMEQVIVPLPGENMSIADIDARLEEINRETRAIVIRATEANSSDAYTDTLAALVRESKALKEKKTALEEHHKENAQSMQQINRAAQLTQEINQPITAWDEPTIRQLVEKVVVQSADCVTVYIKGGCVVTQQIMK